MRQEDEFETILRETEAPKRVDGRSRPKLRIAKLTGRTISSLKNKIKEKRMSFAYDRYNINYTKMRRALIEANSVAKQAQEGKATESEVVEAFDIVASYERRLARWGVKLLKDDIKDVAFHMAKPRAIRVPRILLGKLRPITKAIINAIERRKTKKLQKTLTKEITASTKDYIRDSLEGALFKDSVSGDVRVPVDAKVIQGLAPDKKADTFEEKIAGLRKFISADGKSPIFEEEIGAKEKSATTVTNVAPVAPEASVEKENKTLTNEDLLSGLNNRKTADKGVETTTTEQKSGDNLSVDDLTKSLTPNTGEENKDAGPILGDQKVVEQESEVTLSGEDAELISRRKREIATIVSLGNVIDSLRKQADKTVDPEARETIENYIKDLNNELSAIVERSTAKKTASKDEQPVTEVKDDKPVVEDKVSVEIPVGKHDYVGKHDLEPIIVEPNTKSETKETDSTLVLKDGRKVTIRVKDNNESIRAEQISAPSSLAVSSEDVNKLVSRYEAATSKREELRRERVELEQQKAMLLSQIEQKTRAVEADVENQVRENEALRAEIGNLSSVAGRLK